MHRNEQEHYLESWVPVPTSRHHHIPSSSQRETKILLFISRFLVGRGHLKEWAEGKQVFAARGIWWDGLGGCSVREGAVPAALCSHCTGRVQAHPLMACRAPGSCTSIPLETGHVCGALSFREIRDILLQWVRVFHCHPCCVPQGIQLYTQGERVEVLDGQQMPWCMLQHSEINHSRGLWTSPANFHSGLQLTLSLRRMNSPFDPQAEKSGWRMAWHFDLPLQRGGRVSWEHFSHKSYFPAWIFVPSALTRNMHWGPATHKVMGRSWHQETETLCDSLRQQWAFSGGHLSTAQERR